MSNGGALPGLQGQLPASGPILGPRAGRSILFQGNCSQGKEEGEDQVESPTFSVLGGSDHPLFYARLSVGWYLETVGGHRAGYLCHHQLVLCPGKSLPRGPCALPFRAWAELQDLSSHRLQ